MTRLSAVLFLLIIIIGCNRDEEVFPSIEVMQPNEHESFLYGDTIEVRVRVFSDEAIDWVKITLIDQQFIPSCPSQTIYPGETDNFLTLDYIISNRYIENGQYFLLIEASDKSGSTKKYVSINVSGLPLKSMGLVAVIRNGTNQQAILSIDSIQTVTQTGIHQGDYSSSAVNSNQSLIYINGKSTGALGAYNLNDGTVIWSVPTIQNPPFSYFEKMIYQDNMVVVGYTEGMIQGYTAGGSPRYQFITPQFIPKQMLRHFGMLIVEQLYYTGSGSVISVYYENSGTQKSWMNIGFDVIALFGEDEDEVVIFGNSGSNGISAILDIYNDQCYQIASFGPGNISSAIQIDLHNYILSTSNGIVRYNSLNGQNEFFESGVTPGQLCYDEVDDILYVAHDKIIEIYNQSTSQFLGNITLADTIRDIHILYNK